MGRLAALTLARTALGLGVGFRAALRVAGRTAAAAAAAAAAALAGGRGGSAVGLLDHGTASPQGPGKEREGKPSEQTRGTTEQAVIPPERGGTGYTSVHHHVAPEEQSSRSNPNG